MKKKTFLKKFLCLTALFFTMTLSAKSESKAQKGWVVREEAVFYFNASITILKNSQDFKGISLMNAFSELRKTSTVSSSKNNVGLILQKCLDAESLIPYLSVNTDVNYNKLCLIKYPISFTDDLNLSKFGETITFLSRPDIPSKEIEAFLAFRIIVV